MPAKTYTDEQVAQDALRRAELDALSMIFQQDDDERGFLIDAVETFEEAGIMTMDKGVVLFTTVGTQILLTIQTQ